MTASYSSTRAFSRVDFRVDRSSGDVIDRQVFAPQRLCPYIDSNTDECVWVVDDRAARIRPARYEEITVEPMPAILEIANQAAQEAAQIRMDKLGIVLEAPFTLEGNPESALGNLVLTALRESVAGDVVIHNVSGGLRASLPAGDLIYGSVYQMFPFDNRVVVLDMSGAELRRVFAAQARNQLRRAGIAGMQVDVECSNGDIDVAMRLDSGRLIRDEDRVRVVVNDFLATGGDYILTPAMPEGGFEWDDDPRLTRDVVVDWLGARGGSIHPDQFLHPGKPRWNFVAGFDPTCSP